MFLVFTALTYLHSWWFLVVVLIVVLWKLNLWYIYSSRPWRKVHFPMMRAYALAAGLESGRAQAGGRDFNIRCALRELLLAVNPEVGITHTELIAREFERCRDFYDEGLIKDYLIERKRANLTKVAPLLDAFRDRMNTSNHGLMVRLVIAAVVEEQFSKRDRGEYLFEVLTGRAE